MTDRPKPIDIHASPEVFPLAAMLATGLWAGLSPSARAVLGVIWDFHRKYPDACHPSRETLADLAGVSPPTVSRALDELEEVGIVYSIPAPGPRPNTYRIKWTGLTPPQSRKKAKKAKRTSPFQRPTTEREVYLTQNKEGQDEKKYSYTRTGSQLHEMADGCFVRSAREVVIHEFLTAWRVPHWSEVRYIDLGIRVAKLKSKKPDELDTSSTVDFVVGPKTLVEQLALPPTQTGARYYLQKAASKLVAARKNGWEVIVVKANTKPGDWMLQPILDAWAKATIEEAEALKRRMSGAGKWRVGHQPSLWAEVLIADAKERLARAKPPARPQGFYVRGASEHGVPEDVRVKPQLVLGQHYGLDLQVASEGLLVIPNNTMAPVNPKVSVPMTPVSSSRAEPFEDLARPVWGEEEYQLLDDDDDDTEGDFEDYHDPADLDEDPDDDDEPDDLFGI